MSHENATTKSSPPGGMANHHLMGRDIVIVTIQPWYYELGSNCKNIALELAKHNRVLYVNIPITRKTYLTSNQSKGVKQHCDIIRSKTDTIRHIQENLWEFYPTSLIESINSLPFTSVFRLMNKINNKRFASDIQQAIKTMQFSNIILFNDNDIYNGYHLKEYLKPALYVYYMRDFLQGYAYWKRHSSILEPKLIQKADMVVANSLYYTEYSKQFNQQTTYIGQGCKLDVFNPEKIGHLPDEISQLKKPVIGYVGALDSARLDHEIIRTIAEANLDWQVVLVGPPDDLFERSSLKQLANVHFLGRRPIETLPAYMMGFDVCINPQLKNLITSGNYPLKIDEYLAMGKPIVATATKAMELFQQHVYLANTAEEYPPLIQQALTEHTEIKAQSGQKFAQSHTWENCIAAFYKAVFAFEGMKNNAGRKNSQI